MLQAKCGHLLQQSGLRKVDDKCFAKIITDDGYDTHAWKECITIYRFVKNMIGHESICKNIVKYLANTEEFTPLIPNRYLQSWSNGIYNTESDMFFPYHQKDEWPEMAKSIEEFRVNHLGWVDYTCSPPNNEDVSIKYFDQPFRFEITPEEEAKFDVDAIPLPELEFLFQTQKLTKETQDWMLIFLARLLFPISHKDKWKVVLFIKGVDGSGTSTIQKLIRACFQDHQVTSLYQNVEQRYALSTLYKGLVCILGDIRSNFGLNQADWVAATCGEEVSISEKYKTAFAHTWDTPMLMIGSEYPNYNNNSGSVDRHMVVCEFDKKVLECDPQFGEKMFKNLDLFMRKSNVKYQAAVREHGTKNIWADDPKILPEQMWDFRESMKSIVDPLHGFVTSGIFEFDISYYMPLDVFKTMYGEYRTKNGLEKARWTKDHYQTSFEECGLSTQVDALDYGGRKVRAIFIRGVRVCENLK